MGTLSKLTKILLISTFSLFLTKEIIAPGIAQNSSIEPKPKSKNKTIVIDPGHSLQNPGTGKPEEYILTLDISKRLQSKWIKDGYEVYLTRKDENQVNKDSIDYNPDGKITLEDERLARKQFGKDKEADHFISIHYNANYKNSKKKGMGIFIPGYRKASHSWNRGRDFCKPTSLKYYCKESFDLAKKMAKDIEKNGTKVEIYGADVEILRKSKIKKILRSKDKGKYNKLVKLLKDPNFKADFPSTLLIEVEYLTHKKAREYSNTKEGREYQANLIYEAFNSATESKENSK